MTTITPNLQPGIAMRSARIADATAIARLAGELGYPCELQSIEQRLGWLHAQPGHWVGVAELPPRQLVGWVHVARCMTLETGEFAEILGLVVDGSARRQGIGRALVVAAEQWGREAGLARLTVRSNSARHESHPFYLALGYSRPKSQHVYQKPLEVVAHA